MADYTVLPDFQEFLKSRRLVPDNQVSFYARWVSRFLSFLNQNSLSESDTALRTFISSLTEDQHLQDWQIKQAEHAVRLYVDTFHAGKTAEVLPEAAQAAYGAGCDPAAALRLLREALRLRHYSYSTERTYTEWCRRFLLGLLKQAAERAPHRLSAQYMSGTF